MRKKMQKEVTKTTVKIAKVIAGENGTPELNPLDDVVLIGNVSLEKAQKEVNKLHGAGVTVFGVEADTVVYEMDVEDFIKYANIKDIKDEAASA